MGKPKKKQEFWKQPEIKGGKKALQKFITKNLKYPEEALENGVEGTVSLRYAVNGMGEISNVEVIEGIGFGCDEEAVRLVSGLVYQKAINRGFKTHVNKEINIHFRIPETKASRSNVQFNYQITPTEPPKRMAAKKDVTYNIKVNLVSKKVEE